ncbi:MAG: peptidoglycan editing factor PgeF, partial [Thermomicrobium sp.]|nr:peptidoglycan editing factor PgeF [Thermomicrobium sp.]
MRVQPYRFASLDSAGVPHGVTRRDASLPADGAIGWNVGVDVARRNRVVWWRRLGLPLAFSVFARQVHGAAISVVTAADRGRGACVPETALPDTDALVTTEPGVPVVVQCADCVPLLLYAADLPAVGAVHAGWRGTTLLVALRTIDLLVRQFGASPVALRVAIGPSIGPCCYEVGDDVVERWRHAVGTIGERAIVRRNGRMHFDLWEANRMLVLEAGVPPHNIELAGRCTRCRPREWFSYRADGPRTGMQAAVIALPPERSETE